MLNKPKAQSAGEGAAAIQAGGSANNAVINQTNNYGMTVDDVRAVAQDAFRADFVQLLGQAGDIAEARANRVVERYLDRLQAENPAGLSQANTPDFRYALFTAQKAQARSGDENLEELLVELLIERSRESQRNLQQIVLNEALEVVSRLTDEQIAALTISFIIRRTVNNTIFAFPNFLAAMDEQVQPFIKQGKLSVASFSHLAFTGCGVVEMGQISLSDCFIHTYPELWQSPFHNDDPVVQQLNPAARQFIIPSMHAPGMLEVFGGVKETSARMRESLLPDPMLRAPLDQLLSRPRLSPDQVKERCIVARPYMTELFDLWNDTSMKHFNPSSVGIAIAHANLIRRVPNFGPLSVWIN